MGSVREEEKHYDLLSVVMICLGGQDRENDRRSEEGSGIFKLLGTLLSRETTPEEKKRVLRAEFDIPMTQAMEKEVSLMCNLSEGVWEDGMAQGMAQGMARGIIDGRLSDLHNLMESMGWTMEQAMNALRIPEADRQIYAAQLAGR